MKRSNWKSKILLLIAVIVGIIAGIAVASYVNEVYHKATGLAFFGTLAVVAGLITVIGVKIFRIGD
ncbi:MAG: hypothetical protein HFH24_07795 [Ruminococcus sp.]|nr:hypothetical protein [Ruminococcus sp.]